MLLVNPPGWDYSAGRQRDRRAKDRLRYEDALRMMAQRAVAKLRKDFLAAIDQERNGR